MLRSASKLSLALLTLSGGAAAQTVLSTEHGFGMDDGAITPNGALAVVRENTALTRVRIYDLASGAQVGSAACSQGTFSGAAQDAVVVTDTRAVVLGSCALVLDLTNPAQPLLAEHIIGHSARDVEITPDGTLAVIRGGKSISGFPGGLFVIDLANGALLASHPGEPGNPFTTTYPYDVDSVAVTDDHAVCTSIIDPLGSTRTRVTVWDLHPTGGGAPQVVYETAVGGPAVADQAGSPHDVAITPDGQYAAVRSEFAVGLYRLNGSTSARVWEKRLSGNPGPMGQASMDSIEVTNARIVTASRYSGAGTFGAQCHVFDLAGNQWFDRMRGDPHDLTLTPSGVRALVRTSKGVFLYDIANLPAAPALTPLDYDESLVSTHTFFSAGYDSVLATDARAVAVARSGTSATVRFYDIAGDQLVQLAQSLLPEKHCDVAISPNQRWAAVAGTSYLQVYDFSTRTLELAHDPHPENFGWFPWCDGVELDDRHVVAWGYSDAQSGWVSVVELFPQPSSYCTAGTNSTGHGSHLHATGSASIARNDLTLVALDLPAATKGLFVYAAGQASVPFGGGYWCVSGTRYQMPILSAAGGVALQAADYTGPNALGGAITAGTTWHFQLRYRDLPLAQINFSDGLSITFVN